ncbi:extracellular solute-binding protein [Pseudonocardia nigra]|uniref:extracellular solute-binding protein n=1 Tax=Pseudonocardia nigra TaxID=1921578 RepID=UPI001C5D968D|nr:extracellular solute-binding protein [Pseudonocardia nigra]
MAVATSRRVFLQLAAAGLAAATAGGCARLTGRDIPGRGSGALVVSLLGTSADAAARQALLSGFRAEHPGIEVVLQPIQATDWGDFFAKILTQVAAGTPPDIVYVATEGTQLFAEQLAVPLDDYVRRDAGELAEFFADVHPALVESMMYQGSLFEIPIEFNAANMYFNTGLLRQAGADVPPADWTVDDFVALMRAEQAAGGGGFLPYYWTNRLWGGVVPWLYANGTNLLTESRAPGGQWLWERFYDADTARQRGGGTVYGDPLATADHTVETFEFLAQLIANGLSSRPEEGGGNTLIGLFSGGRIGSTPAGGFWAGGLHDGGMAPDAFDVQFSPRWRTQRHQFGAAGYAIMRTARDVDAAWEFVKYAARRESMEAVMAANQTTPARRSMLTADRYAATGPRNWQVFYDTVDRFPDTGPIPAPAQAAAVQSAVLKHVGTALSAPGNVRASLAAMQADLDTVMGTRS